MPGPGSFNNPIAVFACQFPPAHSHSLSLLRPLAEIRALPPLPRIPYPWYIEPVAIHMCLSSGSTFATFLPTGCGD